MKVGGFTLIELLVVIAIIGVLASIVLASLNSARKKSRDARRIADIKQLQLALEMYFDTAGAYPADIYAASGSLKPTYIPAVPKDPLGQTNYSYIACGTDYLTDYHLGAGLEETGNPALQTDRDAAGTDICPTGDNILGANDNNNASATCAAGSGRNCYDMATK